MEIHGASSVVKTSLPTLLYQGQIPTCDNASNVCEELIIPLISYQRIRYVYISTTTCLKPFVIETFTSKYMFIPLIIFNLSQVNILLTIPANTHVRFTFKCVSTDATHRCYELIHSRVWQMTCVSLGENRTIKCRFNNLFFNVYSI